MIAYVVRLLIWCRAGGQGRVSALLSGGRDRHGIWWRGAGVLATALASMLAFQSLPQQMQRSLPAQWDEVALTLVFAAVNLSLVWLTDSLVQARRERTEALAARERVDLQLNQILNSITDSFAILDRQWRFTYINDAALRSYQTTAKEFSDARCGTSFRIWWRATSSARRARHGNWPTRTVRVLFGTPWPLVRSIVFIPRPRACRCTRPISTSTRSWPKARSDLRGGNARPCPRWNAPVGSRGCVLATLSARITHAAQRHPGLVDFIGINEGLDLAETREAVATIERNARAQAKLIEDLLEMSHHLGQAPARCSGRRFAAGGRTRRWPRCGTRRMPSGFI